jgi:hypothetical protein
VLVTGTKKLLLKWIRRALRQKQIEVPDRNGQAHWSLAHSFFHVGEADLEAESCPEANNEGSALPAECEDTTICETR